jgi:hypothetical protein
MVVVIVIRGVSLVDVLIGDLVELILDVKEDLVHVRGGKLVVARSGVKNDLSLEDLEDVIELCCQA